VRVEGWKGEKVERWKGEKVRGLKGGKDMSGLRWMADSELTGL